MTANKSQIALWNERFDRWLRLHPDPVELTPQLAEAASEGIGPQPDPYKLGDDIEDKFATGGKAVFWTGGVKPVGPEKFKEISRQTNGNTEVVRRRYDCPVKGTGRFRVDFLSYHYLGLKLSEMPNAKLETLRLPTRVVLPFVVMILLSLITPRVKKEELDRFYVKMKTPVDPDPEVDKREIELSYADPTRFDDKRLFKRCGLEIQRPKPVDVIGFIVCFMVCFALIGLTVWLANFTM